MVEVKERSLLGEIDVHTGRDRWTGVRVAETRCRSTGQGLLAGDSRDLGRGCGVDCDDDCWRCACRCLCRVCNHGRSRSPVTANFSTINAEIAQQNVGLETMPEQLP